MIKKKNIQELITHFHWQKFYVTSLSGIVKAILHLALLSSSVESLEVIFVTWLTE